jgi:hypothetical protein
MSNTDSSASARLRQIKAQTLANYRAQNPTAREGGGSKSADASVITERAPGAFPVTRQIDSKPAQVTPPCCAIPCIQVSAPTSIVVISAVLNGSIVTTVLGWTPDPNATSYSFSSNVPSAVFSNITNSTVTMTFDINDPTELGNVTITAINACSRASRTFVDFLNSENFNFGLP